MLSRPLSAAFSCCRVSICTLLSLFTTAGFSAMPIPRAQSRLASQTKPSSQRRRRWRATSSKWTTYGLRGDGMRLAGTGQGRRAAKNTRPTRALP